MPQEVAVRISCTGFARIKDRNERYALLINGGMLRRGHGRILTPIGGGFEVGGRGVDYLMSHFGAEGFEQGHGQVRDLRFRVYDERVEEVVEWFGRREGREISVLREMGEELVTESRVLKSRDLHQVSEKFRRFVRMDGHTTRDVPEKQTVYLIEVFDVGLPEMVIEKLLAAAMVASPDVYFARGDEIRRGVMDDGTKIGEIAMTLLA